MLRTHRPCPHRASLRRISGTEVTVTSIAGATRLTDNASQAATYRHGRVLLAGDAAHVHSPIGGQGLNLGLQDAANLGWKLGLVVHGQAPATLLDTYTTERHPVGAQVLRNSRRDRAAAHRPPNRGTPRACRRAGPDPQATRHLVEQLNGAHIRYTPDPDPDTGDASDDSAHPLAGRFAPDLPLTPGNPPH